MSAEPKAEAYLQQLDALQAKISRTLSEHRQSFGHNDEQFWSYCSCNENEPHVMADGPDVPDPVEKRSFWVAGAQIFADHLAGLAIDEIEEAGWVGPEEATAREAAARREALEAIEWKASPWWRAVGPDGSLWAEASNEAEVRERARPGDTVQRLYATEPQAEWRNA